MTKWPDDKEILCYTCKHLTAMDKAHDHVIRMTCEIIPDAYILTECIEWEEREGEQK
jgi:hypothetical protein